MPLLAAAPILARSGASRLDSTHQFQEFLTVALREALGVSPNTLRSDHVITLDEDGRAELEPDLSWWEDGTCSFVGDAA